MRVLVFVGLALALSTGSDGAGIPNDVTSLEGPGRPSSFCDTAQDHAAVCIERHGVADGLCQSAMQLRDMACKKGRRSRKPKGVELDLGSSNSILMGNVSNSSFDSSAREQIRNAMLKEYSTHRSPTQDADVEAKKYTPEYYKKVLETTFSAEYEADVSRKTTHAVLLSVAAIGKVFQGLQNNICLPLFPSGIPVAEEALSTAELGEGISKLADMDPLSLVELTKKNLKEALGHFKSHELLLGEDDSARNRFSVKGVVKSVKKTAKGAVKSVGKAASTAAAAAKAALLKAVKNLVLKIVPVKMMVNLCDTIKQLLGLKWAFKGMDANAHHRISAGTMTADLAHSIMYQKPGDKEGWYFRWAKDGYLDDHQTKHDEHCCNAEVYIKATMCKGCCCKDGLMSLTTGVSQTRCGRFANDATGEWNMNVTTWTPAAPAPPPAPSSPRPRPLASPPPPPPSPRPRPRPRQSSRRRKKRELALGEAKPAWYTFQSCPSECKAADKPYKWPSKEVSDWGPAQCNAAPDPAASTGGASCAKPTACGSWILQMDALVAGLAKVIMTRQVSAQKGGSYGAMQHCFDRSTSDAIKRICLTQQGHM